VAHDNHLVEFKLNFQNIPYQGFPNQRMDMTLNDNVHANLHYLGQHHWGVLEARVYGDFTRHKMDFARDKQFFYGSAATILAPGMPMDTKGLNLGGLVKADILLSGRNTLRVVSRLSATVCTTGGRVPIRPAAWLCYRGNGAGYIHQYQ